jgi:hypothetical protein
MQYRDEINVAKERGLRDQIISTDFNSYDL